MNESFDQQAAPTDFVLPFPSQAETRSWSAGLLAQTIGENLLDVVVKDVLETESVAQFSVQAAVVDLGRDGRPDWTGEDDNNWRKELLALVEPPTAEDIPPNDQDSLPPVVNDRPLITQMLSHTICLLVCVNYV